MVYSSPEPQFMCASAILKEEKITLQGLGLEAVDDYLSLKTGYSVAVPQSSPRYDRQVPAGNPVKTLSGATFQAGLHTVTSNISVLTLPRLLERSHFLTELRVATTNHPAINRYPLILCYKLLVITHYSECMAWSTVRLPQVLSIYPRCCRTIQGAGELHEVLPNHEAPD